jgi:hypothetical protein
MEWGFRKELFSLKIKNSLNSQNQKKKKKKKKIKLKQKLPIKSKNSKKHDARQNSINKLHENLPCFALIFLLI